MQLKRANTIFVGTTVHQQEFPVVKVLDELSPACKIEQPVCATKIVCALARKRKYKLPPFPSMCTTVFVLLDISELVRGSHTVLDVLPLIDRILVNIFPRYRSG